MDNLRRRADALAAVRAIAALRAGTWKVHALQDVFPDGAREALEPVTRPTLSSASDATLPRC